MTEKETVKVNWAKLIPLLVGLGIGVVVMYIIFFGGSETTDSIPIKTIDPITQNVEKEILLKNPRYANKDLDAIFDDESLPENNVLRFDLKSHPSVDYVKQVGAGNQVVMYYDINSVYQLENALGTPEFIDMKTGEYVDREWRYVVWGNESYESPVVECETKTSINGTQFEDCTQTGTETKTREAWLPYNSRDLKGKQRIGIEVEVKLNDHIDGVWNVGGKKIDRHAEWQASLETGLISWYKLDETSGDVVDSHGTNNGSNDGSTRGVTGIRGNAFEFDGSNDYVALPSGDIIPTGTNPFSVSMWLNQSAAASGTDFYVMLKQDTQFISVTLDNSDFSFGFRGGTNGVAYTTPLVDGSWTHIVMVYTGGAKGSASSYSLYANGSLYETGKSLTSFGGSGTGNVFGADTSNINNYKGRMDEVGIWSRALSLSEVENLYNNGVGCTYQECDVVTGLTITLISPETNTNFTTNNINFSANVTDSDTVSVSNVSLVVNGNITQTNTSGVSGIYNFTETIIDGNHNWTVIAFGNDSVQYNATNGTLYFGVDTAAPQVLVTYPNETITFHELNTNLSLNWSVNDTHLSTCWFDWNGANTTVTCNDNQTTFNITNGTAKSLTFYANDTFGNQNSSTVSWNYRLFLNSETYDSTVTEGQSTTFSANLLTNGSAITAATLTYNGTGNTGTINDHGSNNYTVTRTITVPTVTTETNITFNWTINQSTMSYTLDSNNQTISNLNIDDCTTNSIALYNFTIYDEELPTKVLNATGNNTRADLNLIIRTFGTTTQLANFSNQYTQVNPFRVCLNSTLPASANFNIDVQVQYRATNFSEEFYNIQNATINSSVMPINISLYDLSSDKAQVFKIILRDSSFLPIKDALVEVHRRYVDEGIFRIVEIPKIDSRGEAIAHLVLNSVIYNFKIIKYGVTLATFDDVIAVCQIPLVQECEIDLNAFSDSITLPDFEEAEDFGFTLGYDNSTRIVSSIFTIPSGTTSTVSLNVTREDALGTAVCTDILTSPSGTLSCVVPQSFGNSTIRAEIYRDASLQAQGSIKLDQKPIDIYGGVMIGLSIFLLITLVGVGISNSPVITVLFLMVGIILLFGMNLVASTGFIGATATILWIIVAILIILIKGVGRN